MKTISEAKLPKEIVKEVKYQVKYNGNLESECEQLDLAKFIYDKSFKAGEAQTLEWVEKKVIGKDEEVDEMYYQYKSNLSDEEMEKNSYYHDRNKLRAEQRQLIKQRKDYD